MNDSSLLSGEWRRHDNRGAAPGPSPSSNQFQPLQAGVPVLADDDVVVHGNAERAGNGDDRLRHLDVGARGRRVAGGMIVDEPIRCSRELKSVSLRSSLGELGAAIGGGSKCSLVIIPASHAAPRQIIFECARSVYRGAALHSKADVPLNLFDVGYGRQRNREIRPAPRKTRSEAPPDAGWHRSRRVRGRVPAQYPELLETRSWRSARGDPIATRTPEGC